MPMLQSRPSSAGDVAGNLLRVPAAEWPDGARRLVSGGYVPQASLSRLAIALEVRLLATSLLLFETSQFAYKCSKIAGISHICVLVIYPLLVLPSLLARTALPNPASAGQK